MEEHNKNNFKTLTELVTDLSAKIDEQKNNENIFTKSSTTQQPNTEYRHKINNLESEFYAPEDIKTLLSRDILLEQKIISVKKEINNLSHKIMAEATFENADNVANLKIEKKHLQDELMALEQEYKTIPVWIKLKNKFLYAYNFLLKQFLRLNIFNTMATLQNHNNSAWKKNLQKLDTINSEIDAIIKNSIPYGENEDRYQRLSNNLNKALKLRKNINEE